MATATHVQSAAASVRCSRATNLPAISMACAFATPAPGTLSGVSLSSSVSPLRFHQQHALPGGFARARSVFRRAPPARTMPSMDAPPVRAKPTLPADTVELSIPEARVYGSIVFPLVIAPSDPEAASGPGLIAWAAAHREQIEAARATHGAVLLRGFGAGDPMGLTAQDFGAFVAALGRENFPYIGGNAVRNPIAGTGNRVFTANESPPDKPIPFHHELAQTPDYPDTILFFCERPATTKGETPIVLSTAVYEVLRKEHPAFIQQLETHGVVYSRIMTSHNRPESAIGRGWRATFNAKTREDVERKLAAKGYSWEWRDPNNPKELAAPELAEPLLREMSPVLEAVKVLGTGPDAPKAFFNQLVAVWGGWRDDYNTPEDCVRAGDGSKLDARAMEDAGRVMTDHAVAIPWQPGDIMFIDNLRAQHSRNTFTGPRRVLASLTR